MGQRTGPEDDTFMAQFGSWLPFTALAVVAFGIMWVIGGCVG